jgi:hypothetical protein
MADWQLYNLNTLFPQEVADATAIVADVSGQVADAAEAIATAVEALSSLIIDKTDPLKAAIDALIALLEDTVLDTLNTGVYFYWDVEGWPMGEPHGLIGWSGRFKRSFDDPADRARPVFSNDAEVGAIIIIGGANSLPDLMPLLKALGELFGLKAFLDAWQRFLDGLDGDPLDDIALGISGAPDWSSAKAGDYIPPLQTLASYVNEIIDSLKVASAFTEMLQRLADALNDKADNLREISTRIDEILNQITAVLAYSGLYVLSVESTTGIAGITDGLDRATNPPPLQADSYVAGVCLLAGMADYQKLAELFGV